MKNKNDLTNLPRLLRILVQNIESRKISQFEKDSKTLHIKRYITDISNFKFENCEIDFKVSFVKLDEREVPDVFTDLWINEVCKLSSFYELKTLLSNVFNMNPNDSKNVILKIIQPWFYYKYFQEELIDLEFYTNFVSISFLFGMLKYLGTLKLLLNIIQKNNEINNKNKKQTTGKHSHVSSEMLDRTGNIVKVAIDAIHKKISDINYSTNGKYYLQGLCIEKDMQITRKLKLRRLYPFNLKFEFVEAVPTKNYNLDTAYNLSNNISTWEKIRNIYIHKPTTIIEYETRYSRHTLEEAFTDLFLAIGYLPLFKTGSIRVVSAIETLLINNNKISFDLPINISLKEQIEKWGHKDIPKKEPLFKAKLTSEDLEKFKVFLGKVRLILPNIIPSKFDYIESLYIPKGRNITPELKLQEAIARYQKAIYDSDDYQESLFYAISGLEVLYNNSEGKNKIDLAYKVDTMLRCFLRDEAIFKTICDGYKYYRNAFAHGENRLLRLYYNITPEIEHKENRQIIVRSLFEELLEQESARIKELLPELQELNKLVKKVVNYLRLSILIFQELFYRGVDIDFLTKLLERPLKEKSQKTINKKYSEIEQKQFEKLPTKLKSLEIIQIIPREF